MKIKCLVSGGEDDKGGLIQMEIESLVPGMGVEMEIVFGSWMVKCDEFFFSFPALT